MIGGGRIQLNGWQQAAVAVGSAVGALLDPRRADLIAALGETTGKHAFERVVERMKKSPEGRVGLSLSLYLPLISCIIHFLGDGHNSSSSLV
jgi:ubiquinone biosynthesis protein COQ4